MNQHYVGHIAIVTAGSTWRPSSHLKHESSFKLNCISDLVEALALPHTLFTRQFELAHVIVVKCAPEIKCNEMLSFSFDKKKANAMMCALSSKDRKGADPEVVGPAFR